MSAGRKYIEKLKTIDSEKRYEPKAAIETIKKVSSAKFDETVELHINLGIDPKQADQQLRGTMILPQGTGHEKRIVVVCKEAQADKAKAAGAIEAGEADLIDKIQKGWFDFDILLTSPDMMSKLGRLGRTLGSKGLMPNLKSGTITKDIEKSVQEFKKGKVEYRNDKNGIIHMSIGKASFTADQLMENFLAVYDLLMKEKPSKAKGIYMKTLSIASTMSPGVWIEPLKVKWGESK
eukprot:COSAG01_NODE_1_length_100484_cov_170.446142_101_plen_235_part_00